MVCQFLFIVKAQRASIAFEITLKKFCLLLLFLLCPLFGMFQSHMLVQVFVQPVWLVARNTLEKLILIGTIAIFISLNTTFRNMFIFFFLVLWTGSIFFWILFGTFAIFVGHSGQFFWSLCHFCRGHRLRSGFLISQLFIDRLFLDLSRFRLDFAGELSKPLSFGWRAHRRKCVFLNRAREYYILCMVCYWILGKLVSKVAKGHRCAFFNVIIYKKIKPAYLNWNRCGNF